MTEAVLTLRLMQLAERINSFYPRPAGFPQSNEELQALAEARVVEEQLAKLKASKST